MARILVAEDDQHISRIISLWLRRNGHEITGAGDGLEAWTLVRERCPDLLVTDVNMPKMDGLELLEKVRGEGMTELPVIVMTSRCDQGEIEARACELGAVVHPKPFSPVRLTEAIESALAAATTSEA